MPIQTKSTSFLSMKLVLNYEEFQDSVLVALSCFYLSVLAPAPSTAGSPTFA